MRYVKRLGLLLVVATVFFGLGAGICRLAWTRIEEAVAYRLPTKTLKFDEVKPASAVTVFDAHDRVLDYWYGPQLRLYRPLTEIDPKLREYVMLLEDAKFFMHGGFDVQEIENSLEKNWKKGKIQRGASTITQQLVKNLFLDKQRTLTRKLFEIPWALRVEQDLTKKQILELYLNTIEWGPGIYGAEAAARHFFDRNAAHLEIGQAMFLALIVPNPPRFDLFAHPKFADFLNKKKRDFVGRLVSEHKITPAERDAYLNASFGLVAPDAPHREFPMSHQSTYPGNRDKKSWLLKEIERQLTGQAHNLKIRLSLDRQAQARLDRAAVTEVPGTPERFIVIKSGGALRAIRKVGKGHAVAFPRSPASDAPAEVLTDSSPAPEAAADVPPETLENSAPADAPAPVETLPNEASPAEIPASSTPTAADTAPKAGNASPPEPVLPTGLLPGETLEEMARIPWKNLVR